MKKIKSFEVDHTKIVPGMYISRVDQDIVTYDIRMVQPNGGIYLENDGLHTFEHLFATYVRNSTFENNIVYVGPMGCRTGFYLLVRNMSNADAIKLVLNSMKFIENFEGEIPGATEVECGNYKDHNLNKAKLYAGFMRKILGNYTVYMLKY
ncbi:MAG: S-ribosylhomocysteine lyase [Acutalibacteraceae bacterium]